MQDDDDMKCELRVDYDKLPRVVDRSKGAYGCCAGALYSLELCDEKGLVRSYLFADSDEKCKNKKTALCCWEKCPDDWGANHNGMADNGVAGLSWGCIWP